MGEIVWQRLGNDVSYLSETVPGRALVALSVTLLRGSRQQSATENGYAHLLEHMLFKGSQRYSAADINRLGERLGGTLNAFTDRESTTLHLTVLEEDWQEALDLLMDLLLTPRLEVVELRREKQVVAQEVAMAAEDLEDWFQERVGESFWGNDSLAWPVLGRSCIIRKASAKALRAFHQKSLASAPILVVAVGAHDPVGLATLVEEKLGHLPPVSHPLSNHPPQAHFGQRLRRHSQARQAHLTWMTQASPIDHPDHWAELVANSILGGGMASRLWQELRERQGLAYQISSQLEALSDVGEWSIYAAVSLPQRRAAEAGMARVLADLAAHGPTEQELAWSRQGLRKQWLLGQEDLETRMARRVRQLAWLGRPLADEELLQWIGAVDAQAVLRVFERWQERLEYTLLPR